VTLFLKIEIIVEEEVEDKVGPYVCEADNFLELSVVTL
jgi:hypothetical protein